MSATQAGARMHPTGLRDRLPSISIVAAIAYLLLLTLPLLDMHFNALVAHPEDYATGSFGLAVNASYLALAIAVGTFVPSLLPFRGWSIAVPLLFVPAVFLSAVLAVDPIGVARGNAWVLVPIVGLALAPAITALTMRERFRPQVAVVGSLAIAVLIAFGALVVAPQNVGGLVNRVFDFLVASWIVVAGLALRRPVSRT